MLSYLADPDIIFPGPTTFAPYNGLWLSYLNATGAVDHNDGVRKVNLILSSAIY